MVLSGFRYMCLACVLVAGFGWAAAATACVYAGETFSIGKPFTTKRSDGTEFHFGRYLSFAEDCSYVDHWVRDFPKERLKLVEKRYGWVIKEGPVSWTFHPNGRRFTIRHHSYNETTDQRLYKVD